MGATLRCPHCGERVGNTNKAGDSHYRIRGLVLKRDGSVVAFCKSCTRPFFPDRRDLARGLSRVIQRDRRGLLDDSETLV